MLRRFLHCAMEDHGGTEGTEETRNLDLVIAYIEKYTYGMVCSLATSPKGGVPDDVRVGERGIGGWGTGARARAGWEMKVKSKRRIRCGDAAMQRCSTVAIWRMTEQLSK